MIITHLRATNVLKYSLLELNNLPSKGLIAISGPNESGKTAVVETVCFALFGRTFAQGEAELAKIVRWGEEGCRVEMAFEAGDGNRYRIQRTLDREGVHAAELYRGDEKEPFAVGPGTVRDAITGVCGFDYAQYLDALYLAQMEISAPHPQSETIREIAGTRELENVAAGLEREIRDHKAAIAGLERQVSQLDQQMAALTGDEKAAARLDEQEHTLRGALEKRRGDLERLRALSDDLRTLGVELRNEIGELTALSTEAPIPWWRTQLEALQTAAGKIDEVCETVETDNPLCAKQPLQHEVAELRERIAAIDHALEQTAAHRHRLEVAAGLAEPDPEDDSIMPIPRRMARMRARLAGPRLLRGVLGLLFVVTAVAALALWGLWWMAQAETAGTLAGALLDRIGALWPSWSPEAGRWLGFAAATAAVIAVLVWIASLALEGRIRRGKAAIEALEREQAELKRRIERLGGLGDQPVAVVARVLAEDRDPQLEAILDRLEQGPAAVFLDTAALREELAGWERLQTEIDAALVDLREAVASRIGSLEQSIESGRQALERLEAERTSLAERRARAESLSTRRQKLETDLAEHRRAIRVRELALRLVRGTCRSIYQRFNTVLGRFTGEVLPKFTEGRYRQVQISEDLGLRVFVAEKNDFAELEELSSGTQRQILLAVRLAMAKALVDASGRSRQFIVLDEPFAFFDRERIHLTLRALPELDKRISQIWIISQEFADYDRFKLNIRCNRDAEELVVGAKEGGGLFSLGGSGKTT